MSTAEDGEQLQALGSFIRAQRKLANLSLRQAAALANVSNPYLSQVERGLHEPSVRVIRSIAKALNVSAETLLGSAGLLSDDGPAPAAGTDTEAAIRADAILTDEQKQALLSVYRSYRLANEREAARVDLGGGAGALTLVGREPYPKT